MKKYLLAVTFGLLPVLSHADFMDANWAVQACEAWNQSETLTNKLGKKWVKNDGDRGYKVIRMYRTECGESTAVQITIVDTDDKATCSYGGLPDDKEFNKKMDYLMHATDDHWTCIGKAKWGCGAMGAMTTGKLKFTGPKLEAMSVMGPFGDFLKLTGQIEGEKTACK